MNDESIIRVQKTERYSVINNGFLEDRRLSLKAKGILAYLLTKPNNWKVKVFDIRRHCTDGEKSIYAGIAELKECGYIEQRKLRDKSGKIYATETIVREEPLPQNPPNLEENPQPENGDVENLQEKPEPQNRHAANGDVVTTILVNTDLVNTNVVNSEYTINNGLFSDADFDEPEPQQKPKSKRLQFNSDDMELSALLQTLVSANDPAAKKLNPEATIGEISKIRRLDKRDVAEIRAVIEFSQRSGFWRQHILNGEKLREHYQKLRLKMLEEDEATARRGKAPNGSSYDKRLNYQLNGNQLRDADNIAGNYFPD